MKKYGNLWNKIITIENFRLAYKNATKGKKHYKEVLEIETYGVDKYLEELLLEVKEKRYKVSKYEIFHRITGGKDREIYKLPMRDRIILHAIMIYIEPIFRETFIVDTYSSIKGRGIHKCLKRVKRAVKDIRYKYCLKLDIHKCYPSLDKEILKKKLTKKFKDENLLLLLFTIIDSCDKGVPIGNYTSLYFNNFYFSDFDHWLKEQKHVKYYFRYCDDMVILGKSKEELHLLLYEIKYKIGLLNVSLKSNYLIFPIEARSVDFLGYKIRRNYILIRKHIKKNFIRKIKSMNFDNLTERDINILASYWGILKCADCRNLCKKYIFMIQAKKTKNIGTIKLAGLEYDIFIAKSEELKKQGLLNFKSLPVDEGMLFVINEDNPVETLFHMHNVPFPLDLIFMDDEFKVLDVKRGNPEDDKIEGLASYVLEINADSGVKKGDEAELDDEDTHEYVMKVLDPNGNSLMNLFGGERIVSRRETLVLIKKALKASQSKADKDYKALGKYMFKVIKGLNERPAEYVEGPGKDGE